MEIEMLRTNIIKPLFFRIFGMIVLCLSLGGCIKDDYSDCPTSGSLDLRVTYYNQTVYNTFAKEVSRLDFFIFDENELYLGRVTDTIGPFTNEYKKSLDLPYGKYKVVVWGNLYDDKKIGGEVVAGVTSIDDLQIQLVTSSTRSEPYPGGNYPPFVNFVKPMPKSLFYGITDYVPVITGKHKEQVVDLTRNSNNIHVTLRWKNYDGYYDYSAEHQRTTRAYITGTNGDVDFRNELTRKRNITYIPFYRDPTDEDPFGAQTGGSLIPPQNVNKDHAAVLPDFRTMRLTKGGSAEKLVVTTLLPDGREKIVYVRSIVDLIRLTGQYNTQAEMDRENNYHIVVDFRCIDENHQHGDTWISTTIWVNNWIVKDIESEI